MHRLPATRAAVKARQWLSALAPDPSVGLWWRPQGAPGSTRLGDPGLGPHPAARRRHHDRDRHPRRGRPDDLRLRRGPVLPEHGPARLRELPHHAERVRLVAEGRAPHGRGLRRLPPARRLPGQVPGQGHQRLEPLQGLHAPGLPRADPDHAAQRADPAGQLRALPRRPRARPDERLRGAAGELRALPRRSRPRPALRPRRSAARSTRVGDRAPMTTTGRSGRVWPYLLLLVVVAAATAGVTALLLNVAERKAEGRQPFVRLVEVDEDTTDPAVWGTNWPKQYDSYKLTAERTSTRFGGHGGSEALPPE